MFNTFRTDNLSLAAYLHATGQLTLLKVAARQGGRYCEFVFADPHQFGGSLAAAFEGGDVVSAIQLFASLKKLRQFMTEAKNDVLQSNYNANSNSDKLYVR